MAAHEGHDRKAGPGPEVRAAWRSGWIDRLYEFASRSLQQRVWVDGAEPATVSSHAELMCGYFDDLGFSVDGASELNRTAPYRWAIRDGLVTAAEAGAVEDFHRLADAYATEHPRDAHYLTDPDWLAVASLAADAWHRLKRVARPEVVELMQAREARYGDVPTE